MPWRFILSLIMNSDTFEHSRRQKLVLKKLRSVQGKVRGFCHCHSEKSPSEAHRQLHQPEMVAFTMPAGNGHRQQSQFQNQLYCALFVFVSFNFSCSQSNFVCSFGAAHSAKHFTDGIAKDSFSGVICFLNISEMVSMNV